MGTERRLHTQSTVAGIDFHRTGSARWMVAWMALLVGITASHSVLAWENCAGTIEGNYSAAATHSPPAGSVAHVHTADGGCTGTLVRTVGHRQRNKILTAAHCFRKNPTAQDGVWVRFAQDPNWLQSAAWVRNPNYTIGTEDAEWDFAVVTLANDVPDSVVDVPLVVFLGDVATAYDAGYFTRPMVVGDRTCNSPIPGADSCRTAVDGFPFVLDAAAELEGLLDGLVGSWSFHYPIWYAPTMNEGFCRSQRGDSGGPLVFQSTDGSYVVGVMKGKLDDWGEEEDEFQVWAGPAFDQDEAVPWLLDMLNDDPRTSPFPDPRDAAIYSPQLSVELHDRVVVQHPNLTGWPGHGSVAGGHVVLGADASVGTTYASTFAWLRNRATVHGSLYAHDYRLEAEAVAATPTRYDRIDVGEPVSLDIDSWPQQNDGPVTADEFCGTYRLDGTCQPPQPDGSVSLPPATYADVMVQARGHLYLRHGEYFFDRWTIEPDSYVHLDTSEGPVRVFVGVGLHQFDRGHIIDEDRREVGDFLVGYKCREMGYPCEGVFLEGDWYGTVIASAFHPTYAPGEFLSHKIILNGSNKRHEGAFMGAVEIHQGSVVDHYPFRHPWRDEPVPNGYCGDGIVDDFSGEQCDYALPGPCLSPVPLRPGECTWYPEMMLGNGVIDVIWGEECDDGDANLQCDACIAGKLPTCADNCQNSSETDVDCGGPDCPACSWPYACLVNTDCTTGICENGRCETSCTDFWQNGEETDVDCGGPRCAGCHSGQTCQSTADCAGGSCVPVGGGGLECLYGSATCTDGLANGNETDVDCGGHHCPRCPDLSECNWFRDCSSWVCTQGVCRVPTCHDGMPNGTESDVDCGGDTCPPCDPGNRCVAASDCSSLVCITGWCASATCEDGVQNGLETDVDCGGGTCDACPDGSSCSTNADCLSVFCLDGSCKESGGDCSEVVAVDLGVPGAETTVASDGCVMVRDGYPDWWGPFRTMLLISTQASGTYPIPFSWNNSCSYRGGTSTFVQDWQTERLVGTNSACATIIKLRGPSGGTVTLRYYGS
jgi:hypothetical protein